jgi:NAD(P)-dependent dehydrogenase (short-subunit alcohol dehydrogenase family)
MIKEAKMLLPDKVAIINGGATGMGRATAIMFAEEGCSSVIADVNETDAMETVREVVKRGRECLFVNCDITDLAQIRNCVDQTVKKFGTVHILVGSAGGTPRARGGTPLKKEVKRPGRGIASLEEGFWDVMLALNLKGHAFFCKEVAPYMIKQKYGKIVLISSLGVYSPPVPSAEYHSAKGGILGLVYNTAFELAPYNINVNAILPGPVKTPFYDPLMANLTEEEKEARFEQMGKSVPLQRVGLPEDIAGVALFFASELSSYITGETLIVGGGKPLPVYQEMF